MSERIVKVPDVGEGVAEAELVAWHVAVGDAVVADQPLADVMTDKATVEIPSPVAGTVTWTAGALGDVLAVGSELVRIATGATTPPPAVPPEPDPPDPTPVEPTPVDSTPADPTPGSGSEVVATRANPPQNPPGDGFPCPRALKGGLGAVGDGRAAAGGAGRRRPAGTRPQAAPAVRLRAITAGVDLRLVPGTGPGGRVTHDDLDTHLDVEGLSGGGPTGDAIAGRGPFADEPGADDVTEVKLIGLRKRIAQRMADANAHVPHITYVDEVDLTVLQQLRESINAEPDEPDDAGARRPRLTLLPFLVAAIVDAVRAHPQCNARFDDSEPDGTGKLHVHRGVHVGIATQTDNGLLVPVLRHAETLDLFQTAGEIDRLAGAARDGTATSSELSGSTITVTSLGALGGLVTTPIINRPEVAIVGVNKLQVRPVWDGSTFVPRTMMNLSSSFDHRIVDGWDAAQFVQHIKRRLEAPARLILGRR